MSSVEAFVLGKTLKAKQWEYRLLVLGRGGVLAYSYSKRHKTEGLLDLFDHCDCVLEPGGAEDLYRLKEAERIRHYGGIGKNYQTLLYASLFGRLLWDNSPFLEVDEEHFRLFLKAFEAFERSTAPALIYLKVLYKWLQLEGYAVKEQWLATFSCQERERLQDLLFTPDPSGLQGTPFQVWIESLQRWAKEYTPLRF